MSQPRPTSREAFTLIELLVTISIIAIVVGIGFPVLKNMNSFSRGTAAKNSISVAINAARIFNHRLNQSDMAGVAPFPGSANYSGTAAIFTPGGEIRLTVNDQAAREGNGAGLYLEDQVPAENGFIDITDADYVTVPASAGVVGLRRTGSGPTDFDVIPPPFAIRFNEHGQISTNEATIYYNARGNGYKSTTGGYSGQTPDDWDPRTDASVSTRTDGATELPFCDIPVVNVIVMFDMKSFRSADSPWTSATWMLDNGTPLYVSGQAGLIFSSTSE